MKIVRIDQTFARWNELLQLILSSFAYMNGRIDPPSSALSLTPQSLAEKAGNEIGYVALDGEDLLGCMFLRPERGMPLCRQTRRPAEGAGQGPRQAAASSRRGTLREHVGCLPFGSKRVSN